jgi:nucleotide-binding universal stress UspA family protein
MARLASALVATDFSDEAHAAVQRAAQIATETGIRGELIHVLPGSLPASLHIGAAAQAQQALGVVADEMKRRGLSFESRLVSGEIAGRLAAAASAFDMVIAGARGAGHVMHFLLGRTSTRLVRNSARPILIVKRPPQGPYHRVVAAVDFSQPSLEACAYALRIAPQASFHVVHAFEVEFESSLRLGGAAEEQIHAYRQRARDEALDEMDKSVDKLGHPAERISRVVEHGIPPRVILDAASKTDAELIVLGKHAAGIVEKLVVGSVALRVLEQAACDVLVVPEAS